MAGTLQSKAALAVPPSSLTRFGDVVSSAHFFEKHYKALKVDKSEVADTLQASLSLEFLEIDDKTK